MILQITALLTMFWLFMLAVYLGPYYQRLLARAGK